jgi:hypothetical protein
MRKLRLIWILLGPEEIVALAMFVVTIAVWAVTIAVLR